MYPTAREPGRSAVSPDPLEDDAPALPTHRLSGRPLSVSGLFELLLAANPLLFVSGLFELLLDDEFMLRPPVPLLPAELGAAANSCASSCVASLSPHAGHVGLRDGLVIFLELVLVFFGLLGK